MNAKIFDLKAPSGDWSEWFDLGTHGVNEVFDIIYTAFGNAVASEVRYTEATGPSTTAFKFSITRRTGNVKGDIEIRFKSDSEETPVKCVIVRQKGE